VNNDVDGSIESIRVQMREHLHDACLEALRPVWSRTEVVTGSWGCKNASRSTRGLYSAP